MTAGVKLRDDFVDALNQELAAIGAAVRIDRERPAEPAMMMLRDSAGDAIGLLPDYADAATINCVAKLLADQRDRHSRHSQTE